MDRGGYHWETGRDISLVSGPESKHIGKEWDTKVGTNKIDKRVMCTAPATGIKDPSMSQEIWRNLHCQHSQEEVNVAVSKWQPIEYLDCSLISKLSLSDYMALLLYHFSVLIVILSLFEDVCIYLKNTIEKRQEDLPFIYFLPNRTGLLECRNQELYPCHPCGE